MKLYGYYLSSNTYRARVALNLKGVPYDHEIINVLNGDAASPAYRAVNPQGKVPALEDGNVLVTQSLAILEYLEERIPEPALMPSGVEARARVRSLCLAVVSDMFPLIPGRVRSYLAESLAQDEAGVKRWCHDWVVHGLESVEASLANDPATGMYCHGDTLTLADVCLASAMQVAGRYACDVTPYPTATAIYDRCAGMAAFRDALAENQPDAPPGFKSL